MKKFYAILLTTVLVFSATACGEEPVVSETETNVSEEMITEDISEVIEEAESEIDGPKETASEDLGDDISAIVEAVTSTLWEKMENLSSDIDSYEKYQSNIDLIEGFYTETLEETRLLCIRMREESFAYAQAVMVSDKSNDEKYDAFEEIYDCIYEDAGDDIYDEIYDGVLDEMYDIFYDEILDDAYDTVEYSEWADARSTEYEWWSDTRSDVYEEWSDFRSDVYEFWSDMRGELWENDTERAEKIIADFKEDIEKLKGNDAMEETENLVDGMRPEFKEAMDSYEAFYDEYCDFMKKYNENPSDLKLFAEYADMLSKAADADEAFEEWDESEMNDAELKYYLEVSNRVMQMMVDVI